VYTLALSSSGAAKYSEPQNVERCECGEKRFDRPKSMILMLPVLEMRMFSILRSAGG
jgi:hypothetical protein